jgi:hypothetical protein
MTTLMKKDPRHHGFHSHLHQPRGPKRHSHSRTDTNDIEFKGEPSLDFIAPDLSSFSSLATWVGMERITRRSISSTR